MLSSFRNSPMLPSLASPFAKSGQELYDSLQNVGGTWSDEQVGVFFLSDDERGEQAADLLRAQMSGARGAEELPLQTFVFISGDSGFLTDYSAVTAPTAMENCLFVQLPPTGAVAADFTVSGKLGSELKGFLATAIADGVPSWFRSACPVFASSLSKDELQTLAASGGFSWTGTDLAAGLLRFIEVANGELELVGTEPTISSLILQVEDPLNPGTYQPVDYAIVATLTPKLKVIVDDPSNGTSVVATMTNLVGETYDLGGYFVYDATAQAAFATLPDSITSTGVKTINLTAPYSVTVSFFVYSLGDSLAVIEFLDDTYVPTDNPDVSRSDRLIGIVFTNGSTDAQISEILARYRILPVSLGRSSNLVVVTIAFGANIFQVLSEVAADPQVDVAFVPGLVQVKSFGRETGTDFVFILDENFKYEAEAVTSDVPLSLPGDSMIS